MTHKFSVKTVVAEIGHVTWDAWKPQNGSFQKKEMGHFEVRGHHGISNRWKNPKMAHFYIMDVSLWNFQKETSILAHFGCISYVEIDRWSRLIWNQKYRFLIVWHALRKMTSVKVLRFACIYRINFEHIYGVIFWHI